jgi:glucose/mannose-6-phosphate isomerase
LDTPILNDVSAMRKIDASDMLGFCENAAENFRESEKTADKIQAPKSVPKNIVFAGMGGSAIGGELVKDYVRNSASVPIEISREYHLPTFADKSSLVVLASYSGDTEETLSSFLDAYNRGCMMFCVSSGGALLKYAKKLGVPYLKVKSGMPPRAALPHMLMPLLKLMQEIKMTPASVEIEFKEANALLEDVAKANSADKPEELNFTKVLATHLCGLTPIIYGFGCYRSVALRWKQQFNENSKVPAKWEYFSELNHNETMGWENSAVLARQYGVLLLREKNEPIEIRSRIDTTKTLMAPSVHDVFEVWAQGKSVLAKMLSTTLIGDFTSVYLAFLRNVDPTPVETVTVMKKRIEQNGFKKKVLLELESLK